MEMAERLVTAFVDNLTDTKQFSEVKVNTVTSCTKKQTHFSKPEKDISSGNNLSIRN